MMVSKPVVDLAEALAEPCSELPALDGLFSTGGESVEAAIRLAKVDDLEKWEACSVSPNPDHGSTGAAASATRLDSKAWSRAT